MTDGAAGLSLGDLLQDVAVAEALGPAGSIVHAVTFDSRKVGPGALFVAITGGQADGHDYIDAVIAKGATSILCERLPPKLLPGVAYVRTEDTRRALGSVAHVFFGHPSRQLVLVGVTGTNGKTTTATLLYRLFSALAFKSGLLSTIRNYVGEEIATATHTTGDPLQIAGLMRRMVDAGCTHCFMEVTSIAVDQHRIVGLEFDGAIFTNFTHDHLDYHGTMEAYRDAKKAFFDELPAEAFALVNADDPAAGYMVRDTAASRLTFGTGATDFPLVIHRADTESLSLEIAGTPVKSALVGTFNAHNLCGVYGAAIALGLSPDEVARTLSRLPPVEGRMERVDGPRGLTVVVDFAHTPDALEKVLDSLRASQVGGDLICIVGCGGDRDAEKRPVMGRVAADRASRVYLTSDNPRTEEPQAILDAMLAGIPPDKRGHMTVIPDRALAITTACQEASDGSVILIAGKGHEKYQEVGGVRLPFDDVAQAQAALQSLAAKAANE